ncbi:MAG: chaperonin GroEL, partial [Gemmataceae bacterium]
MGNKHLLFHSAAREKVLHGAGTLADAVRVTLGPRSKCVLIGRKWGRPIVCNDGVTIAREMELKDPEENLGAQMIRQAAEKTGDVVGDGTSTSTVLAQAILGEGIRNVAAGASAIDLKRGLDLGLKIAIDAIKELSRPVESTREKAQVATISAHNDPVLGELVAKAMEKVGREGVVSVEEAKGIETTLEVVEGMQFDRGYLSPYFITEPEKMQAILEEPFILAYEKKISIMKDLLPLLEQLAQARKSLLLIAEDIDGEALATLVVNKVRGVVGCIAVKAPGYGDRRREMMGDLAVLTGGKFISEELGLRLENLKLEDLGKAQRVVCDRDNTMIIGGVGSKAAIEGRCTEIRNQISKSTSEYDREKFQERLARLSGGVAVIKVGAPSEAEMKSRKEALEDAISSTKAAMAEGIVPGGGLTLLRAIDAMEKQENTFHGDEQTGLRILKKALEAPTRTIAENSGMDGGVVVAQMRNGTGNFGFDASKG